MTVVLAQKTYGAFHPLPAFLAADRPQPRPSPVSCFLCAVAASSPSKITSSGARLRCSQVVSTNQRKPHKHLKGNPPRVFFLDVNSLCYRGAQPSLYSFVNWLSLFFSQVTLRDPVVAVLDGEYGNEYRRKLLPSYKAHRRRFIRHLPDPLRASAESEVIDVLRKCSVPVIKINGYEADDVITTLTDQVLQRRHRVVIASPDKDFKQLISKYVQIVMPMPELERWSFYTLRHYIEQYKCDPSCDLSLRCILGDEVDGVPGIQHVAPGFGRKTALKLLRKHGTLAKLLDAAAVRTVGKQYAQDALNKHGDYLRRNLEVLSLRRDAEVQLNEEWLSERDNHSDSAILLSFIQALDRRKRLEDSFQQLH